MNSASFQFAAIAALTVALGLSLIDSPYPNQQYLQHIPTALAIGLLLWVAKRRQLSNFAFACLVLFLALHVYGARYIYSFAPLGEHLTFLSLERNAPPRNHYDRLVHLAFGVLALCPVAELAQGPGRLGRNWARTVAVLFVLAISALYECFEWGLTLLADPAQADRYTGQQGDLWDAQKDMALASLGALLAWPLAGRRES